MLLLRIRCLWLAAAVGSFHLAYSVPWLCPLIVIYVFALIQLARTGSARQAFYFGLVAGLLTAGPQLVCFWTIFGRGAVALWSVLALWIALFVVLARLCLTHFGQYFGVMLLPFVWTGLEYFRSELYYLRFSWLNVGYTFSTPPFLPLESAFGVYGIGFLAVLCASGILLPRPGILRDVPLGLGLIGVVVVMAGAGLLSVMSTLKAGQKGPFVAGVQLEFPTEPTVVESLDLLLAVYPNADLLVLSEYTFQGPVPKSVTSWCHRHQKYLIVGGEDPAPYSNFYNTAYVVGPSGDIIFRQGKSVPIQFFKDGLPAPDQKLWNSPWGKFGICVCYDLSYTRVTDRLIRLGAEAIIVPTMDVADWGGHEHQLHARVAPVRAAEYGVPIFRVASSGISQLTDRSGRVLASAPYPGQGAMLGGHLAIAGSGSLPLDRYLAPFAVAITVLAIGYLTVRSLSKRRTSQAMQNNKCSILNAQ